MSACFSKADIRCAVSHRRNAANEYDASLPNGGAHDADHGYRRETYHRRGPRLGRYCRPLLNWLVRIARSDAVDACRRVLVSRNVVKLSETIFAAIRRAWHAMQPCIMFKEV
jgi:hypothetical protein